MELLLLLTAIFASLTGAAGDRNGAVQQVQGVTMVRSAQTVQTAVQPARRAVPVAALPARRAEHGVWPRLAAVPARDLRLVFERRLE